MAETDREFRHESLQDRESIVKYLNALVEGFQQGHVHLGAGDEEIVLEPDGLLNLEVSARQKSRQMRLTVRISWSADTVDGKRGRLVISPDNPA